MKTFLLLIFFANSLLLTPDPIDLHGRLELVPDKPLKAITTGANIDINVWSMLSKDEQDFFALDFEKKILARFPAGTITATLVTKDNKEVALSYQGGLGASNNSVTLLLNADVGGVPTGIEFTKAIINSSIELKGVKIRWLNHRW